MLVERHHDPAPPPTTPAAAISPPAPTAAHPPATPRRSAMALSTSFAARTSAARTPAFCKGAIFTRTPSLMSGHTSDSLGDELRDRRRGWAARGRGWRPGRKGADQPASPPSRTAHRGASSRSSVAEGIRFRRPPLRSAAVRILHLAFELLHAVVFICLQLLQIGKGRGLRAHLTPRIAFCPALQLPRSAPSSGPRRPRQSAASTTLSHASVIAIDQHRNGARANQIGEVGGGWVGGKRLSDRGGCGPTVAQQRGRGAPSSRQSTSASSGWKVGTGSAAATQSGLRKMHMKPHHTSRPGASEA